MENEKTLEELKTENELFINQLEELKVENELLSNQLKEFNERLKTIDSSMKVAKERNLKLAYSVRFFAETYLTKEEKITIAKEFDKAISAEQLERIYNKYKNQIAPLGAEIDEEFLWSPGFTRELEKFYFTYKGYNPFQAINESIQVIRGQYQIEDSLRLTDDPERIKVLKEAWNVNRENALLAIDEILAITNEILKK